MQTIFPSHVKVSDLQAFQLFSLKMPSGEPLWVVRHKTKTLDKNLPVGKPVPQKRSVEELSAFYAANEEKEISPFGEIEEMDIIDTRPARLLFSDRE